MCFTKLSVNELDEVYSYVKVILGGGGEGAKVDVQISKPEIEVVLCRASKIYQSYIEQWYVENNFGNLMGTDAKKNFTYFFVQDNFLMASRISDWFASMSRVGGHIPWKKDYVTLESGRQIYDLSQESSKPYLPNSRKIHKIMWYTPPVLLNTTLSPMTNGIRNSGMDFNINNVNLSHRGVTYGNHPLNALGNVMDYILVKQAIQEKNRIVYGEFYYNISGDIVEITPVPGKNINLPKDAKLIYYYFDKEDMLGLNNQDLENVNNLINNPTQVNFDLIRWQELNQFSRTWIEEYAIAESKYILGAKWRTVRSIASPSSDYQVEFDYSSLIDESKETKNFLIEDLKESLEKLKTKNIMEEKASIIDSSKTINKVYPKKILFR